MSIKKDEMLGYQKFKKTKTYIVTVELEAVAKTLKEAEELFDKPSLKTSMEQSFGETHRETVEANYINEEVYYDKDDDEVKKIEEYLPIMDEDIDTGEEFENEEDGEWSADEWEWKKNPDGTDKK